MQNTILPYNPFLKDRAKELRSKLTFGEARLWKYIKGKQIKGYDFDRQKPIDNYILDFYYRKLMLAIEIDGASHNSEKYEYDLKRQKQLESYGVKVIRFTEGEVLNNISGVLQHIEEFIIKIENSI